MGARLIKGLTSKVRKVAPLRAAAFRLRHSGAAATVTRVRREHLTYLSRQGLRDLANAVFDAESCARPGAIVEAGVALGGSALVLGAAKSAGRPLKLYDTYARIPPPGERDGPEVHERYRTIVAGESVGIGGGLYYGYRENLLDEVVSSFRRFGLEPAENNIEFVPGLYHQTMKIDFPVAVAHLDCDWYESVLTCLTALVPNLEAGGRLIVDDYGVWSGCARAVDEFFAERQGFRFEQHYRLHVVKDGLC